jgi:hypothetical protein
MRVEKLIKYLTLNIFSLRMMRASLCYTKHFAQRTAQRMNLKTLFFLLKNLSSPSGKIIRSVIQIIYELYAMAYQSCTCILPKIGFYAYNVKNFIWLYAWQTVFVRFSIGTFYFFYHS